MYIKKNKISNLIKKERHKERAQCAKESQRKYGFEKAMIVEGHKKYVNELRMHYSREIAQRDKEIKLLRKEINKHYEIYQKVRSSESNLDQLSTEIEDVVDAMITRVQESVQPFYRTRAKVHATKRRSDKKHEKVETIFRRVKQKKEAI